MTTRHRAPSPPSNATRIPVIAVAGHLGAGKTSLLNHLLRTPGARLGVVVNDFGALNVDAALVTGQVDEAAALSGGCICCLPDAGGLDEALETLTQPRLGLDAILIEASGAADPIALARLIRFSGVERVRLGGVIEVIDAVEHFQTVDTWPEPPLRHAVATLVVVTKADLVLPGERDGRIEQIRHRVAERNPGALVVEARQGRVDPALVFDTASNEDPIDELPIARLLREDAPAHDGHDHAHAVSIALSDAVSPGRLVDLLEDPPPGAYRMKGRVRVRGLRGERGYLVNVVGRMIHVARLPHPPELGELVAIGMELDEATAERCLRAVVSAPDDAPETAGLKRLLRYRRLSD